MARGWERPPRWAVVALSVALVAFVALGVVGYLRHHKPPPAYAAPPGATGTPASPTVSPTLAKLHTLAPDRKLIVSALGSSLTAGAGASTYARNWLWATQQALTHDGFTIDWHLHGLSGHPITAIRAEGLHPTIADQPQLVFVEPGTPNNYSQAVPLNQAQQLTAQTVTDLRSALPNAVIVGLVPNPIRRTGPNSLGATYAQYIDGDRQALAKADAVCDIYAAFSGVDLSKVLKDDAHPNDAGQAIWASTIRTCLGI